jgi:hypothetical protein
MIMTRAQQFFVVFALMSIIGTLPARGEDFHEQRLREGTEAYAAGRIGEAIEEFRIASFGLADRPPLLVESLVRLAIAQHAAASTSSPAMDAVIARFLEVERSSASWSETPVDAGLRSAFEALLSKEVSGDTLSSIPSLAHLAAAGMAKPAEDDQQGKSSAGKDSTVSPEIEHHVLTERAPPLPAEPATVPPSPKPEVDQPIPAPVARDETQPLPADPVAILAAPEPEAPPAIPVTIEEELVEQRPSAAAPPVIEPQMSQRAIDSPIPAEPDPLSDPTGQLLDRASALLRAHGGGKALAMINSAVLADPKNRRLHLARLEASARLGAWDLGLADLGELKVLRPGEESSMIYAAIVLFETRNYALARQYASFSSTASGSNGWIEGYRRKIFAPSRSSTESR